VAIIFEEELMDVRARFKFPYDCGKGRPVMVFLALNHAPLSVGVIEKRQDLSEQDAIVCHHIGEPAALTVLGEFLGESHTVSF
jgi:hypothetical protein